jgi:TatD DNase family protein
MLIDSHCHLDVSEFDDDRSDVLARSRAAGITGILVPAIDRASWTAIAGLARAEAGIYPAYGLHPMFLDRHQDADLGALGEWITQHPCLAIGECGLDFHVEGLDAARQLQILRPQLELAAERELPVILHARRALDPLLAEVRRFPGLRGIVHSFSGSAEQARQWGGRGFLLGIGGPVTYPRAARLRRVVAELPGEQLVLETDAPDQPLCGHQGERNEPARLLGVLETVASLRATTTELLAAETSRNLRQLLRI